MNLLDQRIRTFASQGLSPYEIEERLGMEHYTIHIKYHQALMNGYTTAPASGQAHALSAEEKAERKRERAKEHREEYNRKYRELYHAMRPEKKKARLEQLAEYHKATYEQRKDKINERRRELRRLKKEQANANIQETQTTD